MPYEVKKMGIFKPKPYFQGEWEKYSKINSFRISEQYIKNKN